MIVRAAFLALFFVTLASAQTTATQPETQPANVNTIASLAQSTLRNTKLDNENPPSPTGSWVKWVVLATVLSLAPALAVMVTSFTRIVVVLGLLRQALATPNLPPNQILFALALLMTAVVMTPVIRDVHAGAYEPFSQGVISDTEALAAGETRIREFMIRQLQTGDNTEMVYTFLPKELTAERDFAWRDVPTWSLIPAFVLGELKIAFLMGLRIFLPFVIIDMLVGSVLVSMGILMLPPVLIAMPFKLLMFVLADGWALVAGTLMNSFG
ncbi:MAG: EscR/YscR/HrcR family type III secretion system export apparatus protein [Phycisphaerae bacterium]|nr:EscR/YscR/HrcR family type III secretion system export apparatus protein [Phycisphaerae bacterium]